MKSCTSENHIHIECENGEPVRMRKELRIEGPCAISMDGKEIGISNGYSLWRELDGDNELTSSSHAP